MSLLSTVRHARRVAHLGLPAVLFSAAALLTVPARALAQTIHDSASSDSIRFDQPPIAGPAAKVFRFLFSGVPQWIQIGGVILGAIVAALVAYFGWKYRAQWMHWLKTRSRGYKIALGTTTALVLAVVGGTGAWTWNYMMHVNDFCSSCHVMNSAFNRFARSEHDKLQCHACHQQSIFASSKELYYWVLDRPEKIPPHAKVPNAICETCHQQQNADSIWKRVSATAGHAVHFKSDSADLKGIQCVACHARVVHAFKAADQSCTQSGCHDNQKIKLGKMSEVAPLHCTTCHEFGRPVNEQLAIDSSRAAMVPAKNECYSCHDMRKQLVGAGLDKDPHNAKCGTCHNPHDQTRPNKAYASCATSGCHANADTLTAFHRGIGDHKLTECGACHKPHTWKVESTNCISCHKAIFNDGRPPARKTEESSSASFGHDEDRVRGPALLNNADEPVAVVQQYPTRADSFTHSRHRKVSCLSCHSAKDSHGALLVKKASDCQACHHAKDQRAGTCATCHAPSELEAPRNVSLTIRVTNRSASRAQTVGFAHALHSKETCETCHGTAASKTVVKQCADCHANHHTATASCAACHQQPLKTAHNRASHEGCAGCHKLAGTDQLPASRAVCLACHAELKDHKPNKECAACHRVSWPTHGKKAS